MKNRNIWLLGGLLLTGFLFIFFSPLVSSPSNKEITFDSLYVDYDNRITVHIRNFRDTEECVRKVLEYYEKLNYKAICFVSNKGATRVEHRYMYVHDYKTDRFSLLKCDSIPFSLRVFHIGLKKKFDPIPFEITREADTAYFKGDFDEMNFAILSSFDEATIFAKYDKKDCQAYILVNREGEYKFEFSADIPGTGICRTYKIY